MFTGQSSLAIEVVDDTGRTISLSQPARRIVTLAPHLTELLYDIDAGQWLVATVGHSDYPPAALRLPRVGNYDNLNIETLLGYAPDLILAWHSGNNPYQLQALERLGLQIYRSEPRTLEDIAASLRKLGRLTGRSEAAEKASAQFSQAIETLAIRYSMRKPLRVFYQVWDQPLYTVNGQHLISDVLRLCGMHNVFTELRQLAPQINVEAVLATDPQLIIAAQAGQDAFSRWRVWPQIEAVARNNLFQVDPDLLQRHTRRVLLGAQQVCEFAEQARGKKRGQTH